MTFPASKKKASTAEKILLLLLRLPLVHSSTSYYLKRFNQPFAEKRPSVTAEIRAICRVTATAGRIGGPPRPAQRRDFVVVGASLGIADFLCRRAICRATRAICRAAATAGRIGGPPRPAQCRDFVVVGASLGIAYFLCCRARGRETRQYAGLRRQLGG